MCELSGPDRIMNNSVSRLHVRMHEHSPPAEKYVQAHGGDGLGDAL